MTRTKMDGVIEAVHYTADGKIAIIRVYERHGVVWSDQILLNRNELSERLMQGKRFVVGVRKNNLGSIFETGTRVYEIEGNIVTEGQTSVRDLLTGVPVF